MKERGEARTHPSFGVVTVNRSHGDHSDLFQSDVATPTSMTLEVYEAEVNEELGRDWVHARGQVLEIELSPLQWAEMISSVGQGDGTPCTMRYIGGKKIEGPPREEVLAKRVAAQYAAELGDLRGFVKNARIRVADILEKGGKMKAADREELGRLFGEITKTIHDSGPFLVQQTERALEHMVAEGKAALNEHARHLNLDADAGLMLGGGAIADHELTEPLEGPFLDCAEDCTKHRGCREPTALPPGVSEVDGSEAVQEIGDGVKPAWETGVGPIVDPDQLAPVRPSGEGEHLCRCSDGPHGDTSDGEPNALQLGAACRALDRAAGRGSPAGEVPRVARTEVQEAVDGLAAYGKHLRETVPRPQVPDLGPREHADTPIADLPGRIVAERINAHLRRIDASDVHGDGNSEEHGGTGLGWFGAWAGWNGRKVDLTYVSYQGRSTVELEEARAYLSYLEAGGIGTHHAAEREAED